MDIGATVFQRGDPADLSWLCISYDSKDLVHLINTPPEMAACFMAVFGDKIERCSHDLVSGIYEVQFKDMPWSSRNRMASRLIVLDVLRCLDMQGYMLSASLDLDDGNGGSLFKSSGETWFCCR